MAEPLKLHTFAMSHYSEKIRWALDVTKTPYDEVPWTPFFHIVPALLKGRRGTTVPILDTGDGFVQDSTSILLWLEEHRAPFALLPADGALRRAVLDLEDRFDRMGAHVVRYAYSGAFENPEYLSRLWTKDATPRQARFIRRRFPVLGWTFRRMVGMRPEQIARSRARIDAEMTRLEAQIGEGRRHLVGDTLTAADVTAAALLAPLVCPDEHPVYADETYRAAIAPLTAEWRGRPAFDWVRDLYRRDRRARAAPG